MKRWAIQCMRLRRFWTGCGFTERIQDAQLLPSKMEQQAKAQRMIADGLAVRLVPH